MPPRDNHYPTWRELAAELRRRGLPRRANDTQATMYARLQANPEPQPVLFTELRQTPALIGDSATLDRLSSSFPYYGIRRLDPHCILIPPQQLRSFSRIAQHAGVLLVPADQPSQALAERNAYELAALHFVVALARAFGWPEGSVPSELASVPPPVDPRLEKRALALVDLWTGALEEVIDPSVAEDSAETSPRLPRSRVMKVLRKAIQERRVVRLRYQGGHAGVVTTRVVEPHQLRAGLLRAFCRWRGRERTFRLDRILSLEILDERWSDSTATL